MSNFNPQRVVQDFAARTLKNLEFIELHERSFKAEVYEVTQLINSLLGLIVLPKERFYHQLPSTTLVDLVRDGWPTLQFSIGASRCKNLRHLVYHLRNSISHFNIRFIADQTNDINGIVLWDIDANTEGRVWEVQMNIQELRHLTCRFNRLLETIEFEAASEMVTEGP